jgi:hypothetical protein
MSLTASCRETQASPVQMEGGVPFRREQWQASKPPTRR